VKISQTSYHPSWNSFQFITFNMHIFYNSEKLSYFILPSGYPLSSYTFQRQVDIPLVLIGWNYEVAKQSTKKNLPHF